MCRKWRKGAGITGIFPAAGDGTDCAETYRFT